MPYQVQQIITGKSPPVCVSKDDTLSRALALMIEHDFGQLPVIRKVRDPIERDIPEGMITYEGIVRGMRNFGAKLDDLSVRDVMVAAPMYSLEDDLFDILDRLKETNAVLVVAEFGSGLVGIVTGYDTTEYFRNRTEDLMRVEDIEIMVKDLIKAAYVDKQGELDTARLNAAIIRIAPYKNKKRDAHKERSFDDLTLSEYSALLVLKETWLFFAPIFGVKRSILIELLNSVREIRNALAHFRGSFSTEQRDKLKFAAQWLSRCQEAFLAHRSLEETARLMELFEQHVPTPAPKTVREEFRLYDLNAAAEYAVNESATRGGRYAALVDWLQSRPGRVDQVQLSLDQIEEIIQAELPASARIQRAWWANGASYGHAQLWQEAGWRASSIDLVEGRLTFSRIRERKLAYSDFFGKLLTELRRKRSFPLGDVSADGASWIVIQAIPRAAEACGSFAFSFGRDSRLRVELYLDLADRDQTKSAFDKLYAQKDQLESQVGIIEWERLDNRRASSCGLYHAGHILEEKEHAKLRKWAVETMLKFQPALLEPAEKAILEAKDG